MTSRPLININKLLKKWGLGLVDFGGQFVVVIEDVFGEFVVVVEYNVTPDLLRYIELENRIENILETKVDLVIKNSIRPELKNEILSEVIYI